MILLYLCFLCFFVSGEHSPESQKSCTYQYTNHINGQNINNFEGCTHVDGNVIITTDSFNEMHPSRLEIFSSVKTITGFLNIEGTHFDFKNLSYFRSLEFIHGHSRQGVFYTLNIDSTSLESLELVSLKQIKGRGAAIAYNKKLCYANTIEWESVIDADGHVVILGNRDMEECEADGLICDAQCSDEGCWGAGPKKCISCRNYQEDELCVEECDISNESNGNCQKDCPTTMFQDHDVCKSCHDQCIGCNGPTATDCIYCKYYENDQSCVQVCPETKYPSLGKCSSCPESCQFGCVATYNGPSCNKCSKRENNRLFCTGNCPIGYFQSTNSNNGSISCSLCHNECSSCYGPGPDNCESCKNMKLYKSTGSLSSIRSYSCMPGFEIPKGYPTCKRDSKDDLVYHCFSETNENRTAIILIITSIFLLVTAIFIAIYYYTRKSKISSWTPLLQNDPNNLYLESCQSVANLESSQTHIAIDGKSKTGEDIVTKGIFFKQTTFGKLYFGFENDSKKLIIIKILKEELIKDRDDFKIKMEDIACIKHKYLVQTGIHLTKSNEIMLIRDLMPLGNILDFIKSDRKYKNQIEYPTLLEWCRQIAEGMLYLEQNSIVHRDLAARNVMLHDDNTIKINDYGVLGLLHPTVKEKASAWQAIECIRDQKFSSKSDVWSFGVTAYEVLSVGEDPMDFISCDKDADITSHCELGTKLKNQLIAIDTISKGIPWCLLECWRIQPEKRPTFQTLSSGIQQCIESRYTNNKNQSKLTYIRETQQQMIRQRQSQIIFDEELIPVDTMGDDTANLHVVSPGLGQSACNEINCIKRPNNKIPSDRKYKNKIEYQFLNIK